jgi:hypothetical protein
MEILPLVTSAGFGSSLNYITDSASTGTTSSPDTPVDDSGVDRSGSSQRLFPEALDPFFAKDKDLHARVALPVRFSAMCEVYRYRIAANGTRVDFG